MTRRRKMMRKLGTPLRPRKAPRERLKAHTAHRQSEAALSELFSGGSKARVDVPSFIKKINRLFRGQQ